MILVFIALFLLIVPSMLFLLRVLKYTSASKKNTVILFLAMVYFQIIAILILVGLPVNKSIDIFSVVEHEIVHTFEHNGTEYEVIEADTLLRVRRK